MMESRTKASQKLGFSQDITKASPETAQKMILMMLGSSTDQLELESVHVTKVRASAGLCVCVVLYIYIYIVYIHKIHSSK